MLDPAQQRGELVAFILAQLDAIPYVHQKPTEVEGNLMNHISEPGHAAAPPRSTAKQGQYLAYIHAYTLVLERPPAEVDLQRHFRVTPPRCTAWCSRSNAPVSFDANQGVRAASWCWSTRTPCQCCSRA
jgi:hypothetical protein